jgi:hypothetical protein
VRCRTQEGFGKRIVQLHLIRPVLVTLMVFVHAEVLISIQRDR